MRPVVARDAGVGRLDVDVDAVVEVAQPEDAGIGIVEQAGWDSLGVAARVEGQAPRNVELVRVAAVHVVLVGGHVRAHERQARVKQLQARAHAALVALAGGWQYKQETRESSRKEKQRLVTKAVNTTYTDAHDADADCVDSNVGDMS